MKDKKINYKYYHYNILTEKVMQGRSAGGNVVIYALPDVFDGEGQPTVDASTLIQAIETYQNDGKFELLEILRKAEVASGTPEWKRFWDILYQIPKARAVVDKYGGREALSRYRISRTNQAAALTSMEIYDAKMKEDKSPSLPSFQEYWESDIHGRAGAGTKQVQQKGKEQQQNSGTVTKQVPVKGKDQPE